MSSKVARYIEKVLKFLSPVKGAALVLVLLGIVDHLTYFDVTGSGQNQCITEALVRSFFIFCGLFALFGNGKTAKLRSFIVSIPYFYLSIFYLYTGMILQSHTILTLSTPSLALALWLNLIGSNYEQ